MEKRHLTGIFVLVILSFISSRSYACNQPPIAWINNCPKYAKPGDTVNFDGRDSYDPLPGGGRGPVVAYSWTTTGASQRLPQPERPEDSTIICIYDTPGKYTVSLRVKDDAGWWSSYYSCTVYVVKVNVNMEGVAEEKEINPGGYVPVNEDDDNGNGIEDRYDPGSVNGEDDLVAISLSVSPAYPILDSGELKLMEPNNSQLKVWEFSDRRNLVIPNGNPLKYYKMWTPQQLPQTLYVEGTSPTLGGEALNFSYQVWPSGYDEDIIGVTTVRVKITYPRDTNLNGKIDDPENEFSYNADDPAVLQFYCAAAITACPDHLRWTIEDIGAIRGKWNPHVDGDEYIGKGLNPNVTFTGMPSHNSDFGPKIITLSFEGLSCIFTDTETIEVFFEPTARNNPGPQGQVPGDNITMEDLVP